MHEYYDQQNLLLSDYDTDTISDQHSRCTLQFICTVFENW